MSMLSLSMMARLFVMPWITAWLVFGGLVESTLIAKDERAADAASTSRPEGSHLRGHGRSLMEYLPPIDIGSSSISGSGGSSVSTFGSAMSDGANGLGGTTDFGGSSSSSSSLGGLGEASKPAEAVSLDCYAPMIPYVATQQVTPTWLASYPGSGTKLAWKMIRSFTGLMTGDEYDTNGLTSAGTVVTIKTHYPGHTDPGVFNQFRDRSNRAILLLRHPINAIPSYHNHVYELQNKLPDHSMRAPVSEWIRWRDGNLSVELQRWYDQITYWMEVCEDKNRLIVVFEKLISAEDGASEAAAISKFLSEVDGVETYDEGAIRCLWAKITHNRMDEGTERKSVRTNGGPAPGETYPYTQQQVSEMFNVLRLLKNRWGPVLGEIIDSYLVQLATVTIQ